LECTRPVPVAGNFLLLGALARSANFYTELSAGIYTNLGEVPVPVAGNFLLLGALARSAYFYTELSAGIYTNLGEVIYSDPT